ncbi:uncharacterized protein [Palaemon carinicauda]|uniref:uncharacterized protein n=1 Tax=Palaemon carinicauda TaxID=392227 RepID=UPI0035B67238
MTIYTYDQHPGPLSTLTRTKEGQTKVANDTADSPICFPTQPPILSSQGWKRNVPEELVRMVEMMYERIRTKVITAVEETETFDISVGLHQGSILGMFLFMLFKDMLSEWIRNEELWKLLYADDLLITTENEEDLQRRVLEWQETLEERGLRVIVGKAEVMVSSNYSYSIGG